MVDKIYFVSYPLDNYRFSSELIDDMECFTSMEELKYALVNDHKYNYGHHNEIISNNDIELFNLEADKGNGDIQCYSIIECDIKNRGKMKWIENLNVYTKRNVETLKI